MKKKSPLPTILLCAALICALSTLLFAAFDVRLKTVTYAIHDKRIVTPVRFVMLSDLHRSEFGKEQEDLLRAVEAQDPDAVFLCGDIFDEDREYEKAKTLLEALGKAYPCYYVSGNHEFCAETGEEGFEEFSAILRECGIVWLAGEKTTLTIRDTTLSLFGIEDENRYLTYLASDEKRFREGNFYEDLEALRREVNQKTYSLLLCHKPLPEEARGFDLILSGHCHGGQWRLPPLINGLYAPGQGVFPRYAGGRYAFGETTLLVGRGLCTTSPVPRIFNRPEVVVIELLPEPEE